MKSQEYWRKREQDNIKRLLKNDINYQKEIERIYAENLRNVESRIDSLYRRYSDKNGEISLADVKVIADKTDVTALSETARKMSQDKDFSQYADDLLAKYNLKMQVSRLELLKDEINLELIKNGVNVDKYVADKLTNETKAELKRQAGILGESLGVTDTKLVTNIINGSFSSSTFSERLWGNTQYLANSIDTLLTQSIINGRHPNDVARELRRQFDISQKQAERLMRTESARVHAECAVKSMEKNGVTRYEWVSEPSACKICGPLDGKIFEVKGAEFGNVSHPLFPLHPNCRCAVISVIDKVEAEKRGDEISRLKDENSNNNIPVSLKGLNDDYLNKKREESMLKAGRVNAKKYDAQSESFAKLTNEASMRMRISDIGFRRAIESGNLKSSHELGDDFDKGRIRIEKTLFNLPENIKRSEMPKYGYLSDSDDLFEKKTKHSVLGYGNIIIELDDSVRKRTTYTINDSLVNKRGLITSATPAGTKPTYNGIKEKAIGEINSISEFLNSNKKTNRYIEAQYHGDVTFKNDVKRIIVQDESYLDKLSKEFEQVKNMGIEVLVAPK